MSRAKGSFQVTAVFRIREREGPLVIGVPSEAFVLKVGDRVVAFADDKDKAWRATVIGIDLTGAPRQDQLSIVLSDDNPNILAPGTTLSVEEGKSEPPSRGEIVPVETHDPGSA